MKNSKNILMTAGGIALAISLLFQIIYPSKIVTKTVENIVGSSGAEYLTLLRANDGISINGNYQRGDTRTINATTTCSMLSPSATSTLIRAIFDVTKNATSTDVNRRITLATSTNAFATTSFIAGAYLSGASLNTFNFSTSTGSSGAPGTYGQIFAPSTYLNIIVAGGNQSLVNSVPTTDFSATCSALWQSVR